MSRIESVDPMRSLWHWIAHDLRHYRIKQGMTQAEVGRVLRVQKQAVNNYERADRKITDEHAARLDDLWETGGHFSRLFRYARLGHDPDWFKQHLPLEFQAEELRIFEVCVIPGLLQTEDYARALFKAGGAADPDSETRIRMDRQRALKRSDPPMLWVLLDEQVIRRPVGGHEVMSHQLQRLLELEQLPYITIQVIPVSAGFHVGLEGAFKIMTVDGVDHAYTEAAEGGRLAVSATDVRSFRLRFDRIRATAWPVYLSRKLIKRTMEALR